MAEQRKVGCYNESLTGMGKPLERYEVLMDLTVRKGEQVTHPFDEFLQKATYLPKQSITASNMPTGALSASLQKQQCAGCIPAQPSQLSSRVVPNQADLRAIQRWKEADRDGGGTLDFNEVCPHCALPFVSHPSPSPSPLRLPRLAASLPDRHPSSDDGITGRRTGRPSSQNSSVLTRAPRGRCLPVYGAGQALEHAQHRRGGRSV